MASYDELVENYLKKCNETNNMLSELEEISENHINQAGIYVLYVNSCADNLAEDDEYILPVYIGQSKNLYERRKKHFEKLSYILGLKKKDYKALLKQHKERQYLYCKFRKYLDSKKLTIADVNMKVIELCEADSSILDTLENKYINELFGVQYGFNQFETLHLVPQYKACDDYFFKFLSSAKSDLADCLNDKYVFGFKRFNIKMLMHEIREVMRKMNGCKPQDESLYDLNSEVCQLFRKMCNEFYEFNEFIDLGFIVEELY